MDKFTISKQFSAGFVAAILPAPCDPKESEHWQAGYEAGYEYRKSRTDKLNEYLVSIGRKPWDVLKLSAES